MIDTVKKLFSLLPEHDGWKLSVLLIMMVLGALLELIGIGLLPAFVAILTHPEELLAIPQLSGIFEFLGVNDFESLLYFGIALLAVVFISKNSFVIFYRTIEARYLWNRYKIISSNLFSEYMRAPYTFHLDNNSSVILRNVTEEGRYLVNNVLSSILKLTMNLILAGTIIALLLFADPFITALIILFIGGVGGTLVYLSRNLLSEYGKRANFARGEMIRNVNEGIGGLKDIRVLKREGWFENRFMNQVREYTTLQKRFSVILYSNQPIMETFAVLGMLMIALILHLQGVGTERMITLLTLFAAAIVRMLPAIREIFRDVNNLSYYSYSVLPIHTDLSTLKKHRIKDEAFHSDGEELTKDPKSDSASDGEELTKDPKFKPASDDENLTKDLKFKPASDDENLTKDPKHEAVSTGNTFRLQKSIEFKNVSYRYPNSDKFAIEHVSFSINKGEMIGITGSTGAGKTTIIDLLLGLLKPQKGSITIDGVDLERYLKKRKDPIGYIPQFIFLSDDTLERNIAFGLPDDQIDAERLNRAIELSQLRNVVAGLPDGIKTMIGEQGVRFSGGQRQRIGIARALYNDPDLLIMDEATSALDSDTEGEIINAVENLRGKLTILMITHRTGTMKNCDRVIEVG